MAWYDTLWDKVTDAFSPQTKETISKTYSTAKDVVSVGKDISDIKKSLEPQQGFAAPPKVNLSAGQGRYKISDPTDLQDVGFDSPVMRNAVNNMFGSSNPAVINALTGSLRNVSAGSPTIRLSSSSDVSMPKVRKLRKQRRRYV